MSDGSRVVNVSIEDQLKDAYLEYAMSVIISRAIPDVRDGLKPVQRRILYAMHEGNFYHNKPHKKSAKVVGEVIAKYHPHGDSSIYEAMVRLAQDFSMGTLLIDGQGNFGSIDDDPPAAMRYTEARLQKVTETMLVDLEHETVEYRDNYDGSEKEPTVLPASFPNILANGSEGIAVGMATNMPSHSLSEIIDACLFYISNPECSDLDIVNIVPAPDFPTRGIIINRSATAAAMLSGRGSVMVRGRVEFETINNSRRAIIITEIPYQVVKSRLIEKIAELVKEKRIEGISNIRDESNKKGIRVVIELKRDASEQVVLNHLYKLTPLQSSFPVNALVLNNNRPEVMGVPGIIRNFVQFRTNVVQKRIEFFLKKIREKAHILIGLCVAVESIDEIIAIIKSSKDQAEARAKLLSRTWPISAQMRQLFALIDDKRNTIVNNAFSFTEDQVRAILDMRLSKLTGLESDKINSELTEAGKKIEEYLDILHHKEKLMSILSEELAKIKTQFGIPRRTEICELESDTSMEDLIEREDVLITMTRNGYIKRDSLKNYVQQKRGGKGKIGMRTNEDDDISHLFISNTHHDLLLFSDRGMVYKLKAYNVPNATANSKGRAVANLVSIDPKELVTNVLPIDYGSSSATQGKSLIFATKNGVVRKSDIEDFRRIQSNGKIAIRLDEGDALVGVAVADDESDVLLATGEGLAVRFPVEDLRVIKSRNSSGVKGITLTGGDCLISLSIIHHARENVEDRENFLAIPVKLRLKIAAELRLLEKEGKDPSRANKTLDKAREHSALSQEKIIKMIKDEEFIFTIKDDGLGKRTSAYEYRITNRGGKGIKNINLAHGSRVVASFVADNTYDVALTSSAGKVIRCSIKDISIVGRTTKGVKVVNLEEGQKVVSVASIPPDSEDDDGVEDGGSANAERLL